jgi:hypothetical protein
LTDCGTPLAYTNSTKPNSTFSSKPSGKSALYCWGKGKLQALGTKALYSTTDCNPSNKRTAASERSSNSSTSRNTKIKH